MRSRFSSLHPSMSSVILPAIAVVDSPSIPAAVVALSTLRVDGFIKPRRTRTGPKPDRFSGFLLKKSLVMICAQCLSRNSFQLVFRLRSGAGSIPCLFRMFRIVLCARSWPRLANAPCIRRYPQERFSSAMRTAKAAISCSVGGRPGRR